MNENFEYGLEKTLDEIKQLLLFQIRTKLEGSKKALEKLPNRLKEELLF